MDFFELRRHVVPVTGVPAQDDVRANDPVREYEGAVRHELAGSRVLRSVRSQRRTVNGECPRLRQQAQQVRRGGRETDQHGAVVGRGDAELLGLLFATRDGPGVQHRIDELRVGRGRFRIDEPAHAGDEICGHERVAVRPAQSVAQREAVFESVRGHGPVFSGGRHGRAIGTDRGQAFEHVAQDIERAIGPRELRVERVRLRAIAPPQDGGIEVGGYGAPGLRRVAGLVRAAVAAAATREHQHRCTDR